MSIFNSMNKVFLIGRLGKDPEIRHSQAGVPIANFSVATSESIKKDNGWEDKTEWHNIVVFGNQAKNCETFLHKGSLVFIEGRLQTRSYQNRDGNDVKVTEIIGNSIKFLDSKTSMQNPYVQQDSSKSTDFKSKKEPEETFEVQDDDDDLPF
jgi:single-strand DNA-binding protein